jgi:anaerobic ribonucleoside-triphosphate reductase activating protein
VSRYAKIKYYCISNGDGVGTSVFFTGCHFHCKGCFNSSIWDKNNGKEFNEEIIEKIINSLDYDYVNHISFLGGEPFEPYNIDTLFELIDRVKERYGDKKKIWVWTGYKFEDLLKRKAIHPRELTKIDYLVDGQFIESLKNMNLKNRGSSNQRVIDIKKTFHYNDIVLKEGEY